jgi:hypothetical protein
MNRKARKKVFSSQVMFNLPDGAQTLGIHPKALSTIAEKAGFEITADRSGAPCISTEDAEELWHHPLFLQVTQDVARADAERRTRDRESSVDDQFRMDTKEKLSEYRGYVLRLAQIHKKYLNKVAPLRNETPLAAAYLLYSRVVNLLNMRLECLEAEYWNAGVTLRLIDETVELAEYFSLPPISSEIKSDVRRWFRQNRSPKPSAIRASVAARLKELVPGDEADKYLTNNQDLYGLKSKWIHPTFASIRETLETSVGKDGIVVESYDDRSCSYPRKIHELTMFYRSSIWTAVQGFVLCFNNSIPLDAEDTQYLAGLDRHFSDTPDGL